MTIFGDLVLYRYMGMDLDVYTYYVCVIAKYETTLIYILVFPWYMHNILHMQICK